MTKKNGVDTHDALLELRIAVLKVISSVWEKKDLRDKLLNLSPYEVKKYYKKELDYHLPFLGFGISYYSGQAEWNMYGNNEWTKTELEPLIISLPLLPTDVSQECENLPHIATKFLMQYYQHFPDFLGQPLGSNLKSTDDSAYYKSLESITFPKASSNLKPDDDILKSHSDSYDPFSGYQTIKPNQFRIGISEEAYLNFGSFLLKLIATSWKNDSILQQIDFARYLVANNLLKADWLYPDIQNILKSCKPEFRALKERYCNNLIKLMDEQFDYQFPWKFSPIFIAPRADGDDSFWYKSDDHYKWRIDDHNDVIIRNWIDLELPTPPKGSAPGEAGLALASYNALGPEYPFTCS